MALTKRRTPGEVGTLRGSLFAFGLLSRAMPVKPFANVVGSYTCRNRHKEANEKICHDTHPLPVASLGRGSMGIIAGSDKIRKIHIRDKKFPSCIS